MNVKEFLPEYMASKAEFNDYQSAVVKWKPQNGGRLNQKACWKDCNGISRLWRNARKIKRGIIIRRTVMPDSETQYDRVFPWANRKGEERKTSHTLNM